MTPAEVPDELLLTALQAASDWPVNSFDDSPPDHVEFMREALAAVLPDYREQIAKQIEAERDKVNQAEGATLRDEQVICGVINGLSCALRIVRGEAQ